MHTIARVAVVGSIIIFLVALSQRAMALYHDVSEAAQKGFAAAQSAVTLAKQGEFATSRNEFARAERVFSDASAAFSQINGGIISLTQYIPVLSRVASARNTIAAARELSIAGRDMAAMVDHVRTIQSVMDAKTSVLDVYMQFISTVRSVRSSLGRAQQLLDDVRVGDIPSEYRSQFVTLRSALPGAIAMADRLLEHEPAIADLLGKNGPRKYLFLFQNNHEIRATGGFIGSYGRIDMAYGRVEKFFIDGIFNPDGQLFEKIVPPKPIQKISAAWSLHDSNWFPDFPTSARKAIVFYERTGNPTVDGVVAITPMVLERVLRLTGPIVLSDYDTAVSAENFMERLQYEVEVDYDKAQNRPKKILSDLAPILLERITHPKDGADIRAILDILGTSLAQRDIQIYLRNEALQREISAAGWSGEIRKTPRDFLMVVNSNINGFKTDGVVEETIYHWADIADDGRVVDTVRIVRKHTGGYTPYEWYNKVNADYIRVYVPRGSRLLHVSGQTREFVEPPLDYEALGFRADPDVVQQEQSMTIDDESGTRIYEEQGKTVFGNWIYVSPQETVTLEYRYELPFRVDVRGNGGGASYSILFQKQSGMNSTVVSHISLPESVRAVWSYPAATGVQRYTVPLVHDVFRGVVLAGEERK